MRVAGEVPGSPALDGVRDRKVAFGLLAAEEAWASAGCGAPERAASLVVALGLEQAFLEDFAPLLHDGHVDWSREARPAPAGPRFRAPIDDAVTTLAARLALTGPTVAHVSACAAGALAVAHAAALIERGEAEIVVAGGIDSMVNPLGLGGMARLGAPSPRHEPDACRPFDRRRDGLVIGEGAADVRGRERGARAGPRGRPSWRASSAGGAPRTATA